MFSEHILSISQRYSCHVAAKWFGRNTPSVQCWVKLPVLISFPLLSFSQPDTAVTDSMKLVREVVVTGFQPNNPRYTSLNIEPYSMQEMEEKVPHNLSDALSKLPGISQVTTGNAISKPVIRGLYGNRILILLSGLRFDNQQWQDEHGLGLSATGLKRVEVIKGPASLLYGSDAMGGVINLVGEKPDSSGRRVDAGSTFFSNTLGNISDIGISSRKGSRWWVLRAEAEGHSDYSDGKGVRVLNSRSSGYSMRAASGFEKERWKQENSYYFSFNQYGFILNDIKEFFSPDSRWNRSMAGPHHNVMLHLVNTQNTVYLKNSLLRINGGLQSNLRMEDEGGGEISLNMHLISALQSLRWEKELTRKIYLVVSQQLSLENNTNYGGRILIPDAGISGGTLSAYMRFLLGKIILETGAGGNYNYLKTYMTRNLNAPGEPVQPFLKEGFGGNGMLGFSYNPSGWLTMKTNFSSGYRTPNLAELSSNGLHEGWNRYEIGDPGMKPEQNFNADFSMECNRKQWFFSVSAFHNRFMDYIYLAPSGQQFYGFPVYRYGQQNAALSGAEAEIILSPSLSGGIQWKESFSMVSGTLDDGHHMPFIPANKLTSSIRFEKSGVKKNVKIFAEPELVFVMKQEQPARFETYTTDYFLLNFYSGFSMPSAKGKWRAGISASNLTSRHYYDHLSRLKYYGMYNQGLNIMLSLRKEW